VLLYDKAGEEHYNLISALHKSMRESDPTRRSTGSSACSRRGGAALPRAAHRAFRVRGHRPRRPAALRVAIDAKEAFELLGLPEGSLALAGGGGLLRPRAQVQRPLHRRAEAKTDVAEKPAEPVPPVIRNAVHAPDEGGRLRPRLPLRHAEPEGVGGIECLPES
jgi:putative ATPase